MANKKRLDLSLQKSPGAYLYGEKKDQYSFAPAGMWSSTIAVEFLHAQLVVHSADDHAAGVDSHHLAGRQVGNGDQGLAHQLLRLIGLMDAAQDHTVSAGAVVSTNFSSFLLLGTAVHSLTFTARKSDWEKVSKVT